MIAFTICSNNYLPYAAVLHQSLKRLHPDWIFAVGLVDRLFPGIDYPRFGFDTVIPVEDLQIAGFNDMLSRYNLVELNTAVKPFYFSHLLQAFPREELFLYFDPDIQIFSRLDILADRLSTANFLLIPHFSTPHSGQPGIATPEQRILQRGMYNMGFMGLQRGDSGIQMLAWWREKLLQGCLVRPEKGLFVDQKWIDLVPLYFDGAAIMKNSGCDVAYWNLYENPLSRREGQIYAGEAPLRFYHFSAFEKDNPHYLPRLTAPFGEQMAAILVEIYSDYHQSLLAKGLAEYRTIPYAFLPESRRGTGMKRKIKAALRNWLLS